VSGLYLRPEGLIYGSAAQEAVMSGEGVWLAGSSVAFTYLEVTEGSVKHPTRRLLSLAAIKRIQDACLREKLALLCTPRGSVAGLGWEKTRIMGIVNVTPDSFSDGGQYLNAQSAIAHGAYLRHCGADILDVGGESTRPGAETVSRREEQARVIPVIEGLEPGPLPVSVDTRNAKLMRRALGKGADIINDVSALTHDDDALGVVARAGCPVVLMHAQGDPEIMQKEPHYDDVLLEVYRYLEERIEACLAAGMERSSILVDPGIGFGKTLEHNLLILKNLGLFHGLGCVVLLGASRKRFIGDLTGENLPDQRVPGSLAAVYQAVLQGVQIVRVHDVAQTAQCIGVAEAILWK
jgi:dihydropteroate synthase